ncbi:MAG: hypothetical protein JOZ83_05460 [Silvibacterium sp.]|nr:hypothetical protein [Silvibacterium sp.]
MGQINCSNSNKLVCQIPFATGVYNIGGNTSVPGANQLGQALNSAIAAQVSQLPLTSSSGGTAVLFKSGVPITYDNLGPIMTDRAQTVGRHNLFLSFSASQFLFTDIDGLDISKLPFSYLAESDDKKTNIYTTEQLNAHFKIDQYIAIATFGVTNKLDVSMILPIERVSIGAATSGEQEYLVTKSTNVGSGPFNVAPTHSPGTANGIADITFNAKYVVKTLERSTFSAGLNVRTPTGDDRNYLGSGAWGINPYGVFSYLAKLSPHARFGYEWNSETELNPNLTRPGSNLALSGGLQYDIGADYALKKYFTLAGDLMGDQYQNASKLLLSDPVPSITYSTAPPNPMNTTVYLPTVVSVNSTYWINDISAGFKWRPYKTLILSGNALFQLNNVGMRSRPAPLLGVSYQF